MTKQSIFAVLVLLIFLALPAEAQGPTADPYLLIFSYDRTEEISPVNWQLLGMDSALHPLFKDTISTPALANYQNTTSADFVSPDGTRFAYRNGDEQLIVADSSGEILMTYLTIDAGEGFHWFFGWLDDDTLLFAIFAGGARFFTVDVTDSAPTAIPLERLNAIPVDDPFDSTWQLRFAPGFETVLMPDEGTTALIQDLDGNAEPIAIEEMFAFWNTRASYPAWSHDGQSVALSLHSEGNMNPEPYLYHLETGLRQIAEASCGDSGMCLAEYFAWSPDDARLAYWDTRLGSSGGSVLTILDVETGDLSTLPNLPADNERLYWSPDGNHIAYLWTQYQDTGEMINNNVIVADIETGQVALHYETPGDIMLVGWLSDNEE